MNRAAQGGLALALGFGVALSAIMVADLARPEAVAPGTRLGGVDFSSYCRETYGGASAARLDPAEGAYGWRCWTSFNDIIAYQDLDMQDVCARRYGAPVYAQTYNPADPNSWECFKGPRPD